MNNISINDQKVVKKIVKNSGSSFYWGMNILKSSRRRAIFAIYAFCRTVDDIADSQLSLKKKNNLFGTIYNSKVLEISKNFFGAIMMF